MFHVANPELVLVKELPAEKVLVGKEMVLIVNVERLAMEN